MNEFSELEAELKRLRPRAASPEPAARIEAALAQEITSTPAAGVLPRRGKLRLNWFALALGTAGAAALLIIAFLISRPNPGTQQTTFASTPAPTVRNTPADIAAAQPAAGFVPDGLT